jgi:predicted glutamine amidotransferase
MCGLVGVAGDLSAKEVDIFTNMLRMDTIRGVHSTGVASFKADGSYQIAKATVPGWDFPEMTRGWHSLASATSQIIMGHNRHATRGSVTKANAHPFAHGNIVGMHNGTLTDYSFCPDSKSFGTDSEAMLHSFAEKGAKQTFSNIRGAWAVVWVDIKKRTLNFSRNPQRPLWLMASEDRKVLMWSSEPGLMCWLADREGVSQKFTDPVELKEWGIASYDIPEKLSDPWPKAKWAEYPEKPVPFVERQVYMPWKENDRPPVSTPRGTNTGNSGQTTGLLAHTPTESRQNPPPAFYIKDTAAFFVGFDQPVDKFQHIAPDGRILKNDNEVSFIFRNKPRCACCGAEVLSTERWRSIQGTDALVCQTCAESETALGGYVKRYVA